MADQKEWAKLWFSALSDEDVLALSPADRWAWAALIVYTKKQGTNGTVMIRPQSDFLAVALGVLPAQLLSTLKRLPHVQIVDAQSEHGIVACSFSNWYKYQVDSTHAERQKRARCKSREKERGVSKQKEIPPQTPLLEKPNLPQKRKRAIPPAPFSESPKLFPLGKAEDTPQGSAVGPDGNAAVPWPSAQALVALYNREAPDELPAVEKITPQRVKRAKQVLASFPELAYWRRVFRNAGESKFLRGLVSAKSGHSKPFKADFDWFLGTNDKGVENHVRVYEGRFDNDA